MKDGYVRWLRAIADTIWLSQNIIVNGWILLVFALGFVSRKSHKHKDKSDKILNGLDLVSTVMLHQNNHNSIKSKYVYNGPR